MTRQIDRLAELDGVEDSGIDVDDLDSIADDMDDRSVEDLIEEFDVLDCDLDTPQVGAPVIEPEPEPPATEPSASEPTATTETTEPTTEPPAPPATDPEVDPTGTPDTTPAPEAPTAPADSPTDIGDAVAIDIGSTGPGDETGLDQSTEDTLATYGMLGFVYSPNTNVVELRVRRTEDLFDEETEYLNSESITMSAATTMTIEEVLAAYRTALEGLGIEFDFSESTSTDDGRQTVALEASPSDFDLALGNWEVSVMQEVDTPGVVLIEVGRLATVSGVVPSIVAPARELLQATTDIGSNLGWTFTGYSYSLNVSSFDDSLFESGGVEWDVSEDNTVSAAAAAIQEAVGAPIDNEDISEDTISWAEDNEGRAFWFVRYSEFSGTTVDYSP